MSLSFAPIVFVVGSASLRAQTITLLHPVYVEHYTTPKADAPSVCGTGRITSVGIQRRILAMFDARLERVDDLATVSSDVRLRSRSAFDEEQVRSSLNEEGSTFTVLSTKDRIVGGWSGSAVIDGDGTLLGIITDADTFEQNAGLAVAATTLRYLLDQARSQSATGTDRFLDQAAVGVLAGLPWTVRGARTNSSARPVRDGE